MSTNQVEVHQTNSESFKVTLVDTGLNTMTAGRLQRVKDYIGEDENFMLTYGDGVSNVDLKKLVDFHLKHEKSATVTTVQPAGKFGVLNANENGLVKVTEPGLMADFLCSIKVYLIFLKAKILPISCGNKNQCMNWSKTVNLFLASILGFGSAWIF